MSELLLNELSRKGQRGYGVPEADVPHASLPADLLRASAPALPEVSEVDLNRHFTRLSRLNYALTTTFYPLGSCTMKYNPPVNEKIAALPGLSNLHPYQPEGTIQGALELMHTLGEGLCEIGGMDAFTLQPAAGAQGEFTGLLIIGAYFKSKGEKRTKIIVPDSAHGTNPASAALAGFEILPLHSEPDGSLDPEKVRALMTPEVAALMLTVPNTLGVFEKNILAIAQIAHKNGSLLYYDGANLNALLGFARPGDLGFDIMHTNLHKTFSTPHGGGGPGAGPVGVKKFLEPFLPVPVIVKRRNKYSFDYDRPQSIGRVRSFYGNFPVIVRAAAYIAALGGEGLKKVSAQAVTNANYLLAVLKEHLPAPAGNRCMHEFVLSGKPLAQNGVRTLDVAKRLLDHGYYAPTIYFPLIVEEAVMIEPTETESKGTLDTFAETFISILREAGTDAASVKNTPAKTPVSRLNEVEAARKPTLRWPRLLGLLLVSAFMMTAVSCSKSAPKADVVIWHWMTDRQETFDKLAAQYQEEKGVRVLFETYAPSEVYKNKVRAAASGKLLPDIYSPLGDDKREVASFINAGYIADLADEMNRGWKERFYPKSLQQNTYDEGNEWKVKPGIYGVPIDISAMMIYYNKDLFRKAGLDPERPPETWNEFMETGRKLRAANIQPFVGGFGEEWMIGAFASSYEWNMLGKNGIIALINGEIPYTDPRVVRVLSLFNEMRQNGLFASGIATMVNKDAERVFTTGKAAMALNGSWGVNVYHTMNPGLNYGIMMPPKLTEGKYPIRIFGGAGSSLSVNPQSPNKDKAVEFLKWLTDGPQQIFLANATRNIPSNRDAAKGNLLPVLQQFAANINNTFDALPVVEEWQVTGTFNRNLQSIIIGEKTPEKAGLDIQAEKERHGKK